MTRVAHALIVGLTLIFAGMAGSASYARVLAPLCRVMLQPLGARQGWQVEALDVSEAEVGTATLDVHGRTTIGSPVAIVDAQMMVAALAETPVAFLGVLLVWPVTRRRDYAIRLLIGVPCLIAVDAAITTATLVEGFANARAMQSGDDDPLTIWARASHFFEAGGRILVGLTLGIGAAAASAAWSRRAIRGFAGG